MRSAGGETLGVRSFALSVREIARQSSTLFVTATRLVMCGLRSFQLTNNPGTDETIHHSMGWARETYTVTQRKVACAMRRAMHVCWTKSMHPWVKLNADGAVDNSMNVGVGGVLRDADGNWLL